MMKLNYSSMINYYSMDEGKANNFNSTFLTPILLTSDYVQIVYLILTFCAGIPLNVYTFFKLFHQYYVTKSRILLLSLHLNLSDLMILFFFVFPKICWLFTYQWLGGTVLCKVVKFAQTMSVALSSNVIVCIGLDRLVSLSGPLQVRATASRRCKKMLLVAWLLAVCCSAPQLHVWTVFEPAPDWGQCMDVWTVWEYGIISSPLAETVKTIYSVGHIAVLCWLPFIIVVICYLIVLKLVYTNLSDVQEICIMETKSASFNDQPSSSSPGKRIGEFAGSLSKGSDGFGPIHSQSTASLKPQPNPVLRRFISETRAARTKYVALKMTMLIITAYLGFWLPYNVMTVWHVAHIQTYALYVDKYLYIFYNFIAINAVVNPLIYSRLSFSFCGVRKNMRAAAKVRFVMAK